MTIFYGEIVWGWLEVWVECLSNLNLIFWLLFNPERPLVFRIPWTRTFKLLKSFPVMSRSKLLFYFCEKADVSNLILPNKKQSEKTSPNNLHMLQTGLHVKSVSL